MISNNEGKFHYRIVRNLSALVAGRTNHKATRRCVLTVCIASRRRSCSQLTYLDGRDKFLLTELPPIDAFYSSLSEETIITEEYDRAQNVWREFGIENMQQYHDLYLNLDVLLLADVFENFRQTCILNYGLDLAHYYTLSGFVFD